MKYFYEILVGFTVIMFFILWILGFVIAKGFWSTLACLFPFYAFYLDIEFFFNLIMKHLS